MVKDWYEDDDNYLKEFCPRQLLHLFYIKDYNLRFYNMKAKKWEKDVFIKGQFGESLLLGITANDETVEALEKHKKTGADRIDETRIRQMAHIAKIKFMYHQIPVHEAINTQVPLAAHIERDVYIRTRLDLFPTQILVDPKIANSTPEFACIDIKFPKSLAGFGEYDWSNPHRIDHCQPDSIFWQFDRLDLKLLKNLFPEYDNNIGFDNVYSPKVLSLLPQIKFFYFVIAYNSVTEDNILIMPHEKDKDGTGYRQKEYAERQRKALELIEYFFEMGFDPKPYINIKAGMGCHKCPLNKKLNTDGYCEDFIF